MNIQFVEIQNFRKLKSIRIDFTTNTTVFVGANNSGKTSAIDSLHSFLVDQSGFTTNDFTLSNWTGINKIGAEWETLANSPGSPGPSLDAWEALLPSLDLWLHVGTGEFHYVNRLFPTLDWEGGLLGVRLRFEPENVDALFKEYVSAIRDAQNTKKAAPQQSGSDLHTVALWPRTMREFLDRRLRAHFKVRCYSLDPAKQKAPSNGIALPQPLPLGSEPIDGDPLKGLIQINTISAQRDFADVNSNRDRAVGGERREARRLSTQLRSYYEKHLNPLDSPDPSDLEALLAIQEAEKMFDRKLRTGFSAALEEVENLGYPGVTDPKLTIATKIRLTDGLDHNAAVQYDVTPDDGTGTSGPLRLPEDYNGLGYQNLISMVFRLMSFRDGWMQVGKAAKTTSASSSQGFFPPPLHLVLIEEPEAHLHAQVQQVFIRKAYDLLRNHSNLGANTKLRTQLVVSTHSSHIAHECEFSCLRYFRRKSASKAGEVPITTVVNLSEVFGEVPNTQRFVTRYLKATHCDLFFADAAILVEGPAERMLVPQFVRNQFPQLRQSYITLLEIGGSHAHRLRPLIQHLGLVTLVITDLDAAVSPAGSGVPPARGKAQGTRNATLKTWLPARDSLDDLLDAKEDQKVKTYDDLFSVFSVRVAYQYPLKIQLNDKSSPIEVVPNTFEDALVYDNLQIFKNHKSSGDREAIRKAIDKCTTGTELGEEMFKILKTAKKAEFALDLLDLEEDPWPIAPPTYIREGLSWLEKQLQRKQQEALVSGEPPKTETEVQK
jgi:predicted ATP-dependent endonuclease of OLD family